MTGSSGWQQLRAMFREKAPPRPPLDCPSCGWPLREARGVLYCPHGDWRGTPESARASGTAWVEDPFTSDFQSYF